MTAGLADTDQYPSLNLLVFALSPVAMPGWSDFNITYRERVRTLHPVQAHRFTFDYKEDGVARRGVEDWYLLGQYLIRVSVKADADVWTLSEYLGLRNDMEVMLQSFTPESYFDISEGYSIALPSDWQRGEVTGYDYCATNAGTGGLACVQVRPAPGYQTSATIKAYGDTLTIEGATILSREVVYPMRPNPGYRMDYERTTQPGERLRGAALITLAREKAFWVVVEFPSARWAASSLLVDDILLRVAIKP